MTLLKSAARMISAGALAIMLAGPAFADGDDDEAAGPSLGVSFNIGGQSDYIFRGFSQSGGNPAIQGGLDVTYGMFYVGVWASSIDFGPAGAATGPDIVQAEVDFYAGITPKLGPVDLDIGVIYYVYPGARDTGAELDYWELKAGASVTLMEKLGLGATVYYSPEYTAKTGQVWTVEGTASYEFPALAGITPSFSATLGSSISDNDPQFIVAFSDDSYVYWNAGITFGVDKLSFDFRYWDTDVSVPGFCSGPLFQCDERFSFTAKFTY